MCRKPSRRPLDPGRRIFYFLWMQMYAPMDRDSHEDYRVWFIEKLIINFALPSDFFWHTFRALFQGDRSQTAYERLAGLWHGKVSKYQKLLRVKDENGGGGLAAYSGRWQAKAG